MPLIIAVVVIIFIFVKLHDDKKELDIAFPSPIGIKRLLAAFAPIERM